MPDGNNPTIAVGGIQFAPDSLVDLAADVMADPKVERPVTGGQSHGDSFANEAHVFNVINPDSSPVLHCDSPNFQGVECRGADIAEVLTKVAK